MNAKPQPTKDNSCLKGLVAIIAFIGLLGVMILRDNGRQQEKNRQDADERQVDEQIKKMKEKLHLDQLQQDFERQK